ncbi:class I lanthipeptide [Flammeovirga pectinis]|uniref:class I lanthipeptide n=1 Tax=Flammeovirga pectinis TaxID=2494373 RepID=UPI0012D7E8F0|nr:class I lanthipeptide [Flammeovirga pectinis]
MKKKIKLNKETLVSLQEDQMKSSFGAEQSNDSGAVCDNEIGALAIAADSCCKKSCN